MAILLSATTALLALASSVSAQSAAASVGAGQSAATSAPAAGTPTAVAASGAAAPTASAVEVPSAPQTYSNSLVGVYTITQDTGGDVALVSKHFTWPELPYQADTGNGPRGTMQGYNICNSTTQNQDSWCMTQFFNGPTDFCLWGSPTPNETVGNIEEEMVAYCTTKKYGTRLLRQGSITGMQFIETPDYIEVVGFIDQTALNLTADDTGGEEDPHGQDKRGNPLGSLSYSSAFGVGPLLPNGTASPYQQIQEWSYFVGGGVFCLKFCSPSSSQAGVLCQHVYDESGCILNAPADYPSINGTFQACKGDDMLPVGQFILPDGATTSYIQGSGPIPSIPIPSTSSCSTFTSSAVFTELLATATPSASSSASSKGSSGSGSSAKPTGSSAHNNSDNSDSSAVGGLSMSAGMTIAAVVGSMVVLGAMAI